MGKGSKGGVTQSSIGNNAIMNRTQYGVKFPYVTSNSWK